MIHAETVQVQENVPWLPPGSTARLVVSRELPRAELITTAFVLAFDAQALLLANVSGDERGWEPPGGHLRAGEAPAEAAAREAREEACAVVADLCPFGFQHFHVPNATGAAGRYPTPDSYQVFFLARVERLESFGASAESAGRKLLSPNEARATRWVKEHSPFYEAALNEIAAAS